MAAMPARVLPTLESVAAEAGVSRSTVSRVINASPNVRPEVVEAVNAAISRLNYVPNRAARSLASNRTFAVALLVSEDTTRFFGDPFFASVVRGITEALEPSEYILNLLVTSDDPNGKTRRYLQGGNVDGALVVSHHAGNTDLVALNDAMPVVFGGRPVVPRMGPCFYVDVDNVDGAAQATRHLLARGCRRIGTIAGPADMTAAVDRLRGWRDSLAEAGLPTDAVIHGDFLEASGAAAMQRLLSVHGDLDGVFVASDAMARGALTSLSQQGLSVPGDIAVVGFDDSPVATSVSPALTTVSQPSTQMGAMMARLLLQRLSGEQPPTAVLLPARLVIRDTA